jgi:integrase
LREEPLRRRLDLGEPRDELGRGQHLRPAPRDAADACHLAQYLPVRPILATPMPFTIFPHMLRHACGYALANAGHDTRALQAWLGHKNIQHTVRYTELAPDRFKNFWRD